MKITRVETITVAVPLHASTKASLFKELVTLAEQSWQIYDPVALLDAMVRHPILMNRPVVVTPLGARLCRPSEAVLEILPLPQRSAFAKEDGEAVIDAKGQRVG